MHFANARTLAAMVLAWTAFLLAYDQQANPKSLATYWDEVTARTTRSASDSSADRPQLRAIMPGLCCADCLGAAADVLGRFSWLGPPRPVAGTHEVDFDLRDVEHADLGAINQALSSRGLVPDRVEVFGMGHFRLFVELGSTFTCGGVSDDLERLVRKESQDRWLDSIVMDPNDDRTMLVYPRLNAVVDLMDLTRGLGRAGLSIRSIEIRTGPE
jgi:hypothetical protein